MTGKEFAEKYDENQLKEIARDIAGSVVIRTDNGDFRRQTTADEREAIKAIGESALCAYSYRKGDIDGILDMAEFMMHRLVPHANAYTTIYIPLRKVTETGLWEKKGE